MNPESPRPSSTNGASTPTGPGPVVVTAKGHSGTRFIAQALEEAGVFMGADQNAAFDSMSWHDDFAVPIMNRDDYPNWPLGDPSFEAFVDERLDATLRRYTDERTVDGSWGWKGSTLFVTPLIVRAFPGMRLLHIVRDGRDVCLSQDGRLNLPLHYPLDRRNPLKRARQYLDGRRDRASRDDYRMKIFFGSSEVDRFLDIPIDKQSIEDHRYLLQMQSWVRNVTEARRFGEGLGDRYLEIRYESLCERPRDVMTDVLGWLELPVTDAALNFVDGAARTSSIRKWERLQLPPDRKADFDRACEHGHDLLVELGYEQ